METSREGSCDYSYGSSDASELEAVPHSQNVADSCTKPLYNKLYSTAFQLCLCFFLNKCDGGCCVFRCAWSCWAMIGML